MTPLKRFTVPIAKREPKSKYYLTTFAGTNQYDTIDEVVLFLLTNRIYDDFVHLKILKIEKTVMIIS